MKHLNSNPTTLTQHALSTKHSFDFGRARILSFEASYKKELLAK